MAIDPKDPFEDDDDEKREEGFDPEEYLNEMDEEDFKEAEEEIKMSASA